MKDILNMSEVQLNIECAKFMGYKIVYIENNYAHGYYAQKFSEHLGHNVNYKVPEYSKSLDLIHQVEQKLAQDTDTIERYSYSLKYVVLQNGNYKSWKAIIASPIDRLKAVLLTIQEGE